jgi:hypothetical protein
VLAVIVTIQEEEFQNLILIFSMHLEENLKKVINNKTMPFLT